MAFNLRTPKGSTSRAGSNTQPWENPGSFTPEQTTAGYGNVPGMTLKPETAYAASPTGFTPNNTSPIGLSGFQANVNKMFGTKLGNMEGLQDGNYMYTDPTTGQQTSMALSPEQLDAVQNPTQGAGTTPGLAESLGGVQGIAQGLGALGQMAGAYVGYKNYNLAKDQYGFENNLARANYENAAKSYNTNLQNSADVGLALAGSSMTPEQKAAYQNQIATNKVNTTL